MSSSHKVDAGLAYFRQAFASGRLPHAILVVGNSRGAGLRLTEGILQTVFNETGVAALHKNVDIHWEEPESKSRQIRVEAARGMQDFLSLTSYSGGWKACVILFADRMNSDAQNILLKTLEEPPPNSLLILVSDAPLALLPTVRSRTQFIDVVEAEDYSTRPWYEAVVDLLRHPPVRLLCDMLAWTDRLLLPLRDLERQAREEEENRQPADEEADAEAPSAAEENVSSAGLPKARKDLIEARVVTRVKEMQEELWCVVQNWQRDVLARRQSPESPPIYFPEDAAALDAQARGLSLADALRRVEVIDEARELMTHNIRPSSACPRIARAISVLPGR